ncbi:ubiquinone/menaquinone biosynthesis C-methylase UbiE [Micromonospora pisi]|uniref:Ubiquinone/menaquinone biosynthesis C-methylase UbiE n=1 Tax=Micromonospora pisi TaxID=589240 RepID=A0A495JV28_9ACTN|nr:methyltransferase [Micromonospora pisi]RKR92876.1 ubiquinone/menaquinone biosynthesis C-methylase UbiE [Micromonospora pisi]
MVDQPVRRVFAPPQSGAAHPDQPPPPNPARLTAVASGFMTAKALFVAAEVGLFAALPAEGATARTIADRCQLPVRSARALADLLVATGLLEHDGERYRNAADAEAFLAGRGPLDMRPMLTYWDTVSYPAWTRASTAFRTRQGVRADLSDAQTQAYEASVALVTAETAADLAGAYDFGPHRRVLDIGGGLGTFAKPILASYPQLTATLVDLPEVVAVAQGEIADDVLAQRLDLLGCDVFTDPLPVGHDVVVVANFLHLFSPERNIELLSRLAKVVAPEARLLLVDWWRDAAAPHPATRLGSGEFLMISGGDTYEASEVTQWLEASGWALVAHLPLAAPAGLIVAESTVAGALEP